MAFYVSHVGEAATRRSYGPLLEQIFECLASTAITEFGLTCLPFNSQDLTSPLDVPSGLVVKNMPVDTVQNILKDCTDSRFIYNFGNTTAGFDAFNPPNNFFQMASSISYKGKHTFLYSELVAASSHLSLSDLHANVVLVVPEYQSDSWMTMPAIKINDDLAVDEINKFEKNSKAKEMRFNEQRQWEKLPPAIRDKLKDIRFYKGCLRTSQYRSYSTVTLKRFNILTSPLLCRTNFILPYRLIIKLL